MPSEPWLHPGIEVRESEIHGRGLFATGSLDAGLVVVRLGGRLVGTEELRELFALATMDAYVDTVTFEEDQHLVLPAGASPSRRLAGLAVVAAGVVVTTLLTATVSTYVGAQAFA